MKLNGVKRIPSSLVACLVNGEEVQITELAYEGFSFRTAGELPNITRIELHFFHFADSNYQLELLTSYTMKQERNRFGISYTILTEQAGYKAQTASLFRDYSNYISLKMMGDDSHLSEQMVNYPAQEDNYFHTSLEEQKHEWFQGLEKIEYQVNHDYELAISIDNYVSYQKYLESDIQQYYEQLLETHNLQNHPLFKRNPTRLYIGNQFCHNLLPTYKLFRRIMDKANQEKLAITLEFPYLRDELLVETSELLNEIYHDQKTQGEPIEIIVNDWGMLTLLQDKTDFFILNLGILLNKRRKDPRFQYKHGWSENVDNLAENNLNGAKFYHFLKDDWKITRFEQESCGYPFHVPKGKNSLSIPFYQTNTSQFCTMYAKCSTGERGNQKLVAACPRYCEETAYLYPKHLKMIGKYNSLFAYDDSILRDANLMEYYLENGIDRIALKLL